MQRFGYKQVLTLTAFLLIVPPALAGPPEEGDAPDLAGLQRRTAAEWYGYATDHLKKGRWFERSADQLQEAVRQEPDSFRYRLALGCALASRAASISDAASRIRRFREYQDKYHSHLVQWEAAQKDPPSPDYGKPRPVAPVLRTHDDAKPFLLSQTEVVGLFAEQAKAARAEWSQAAVLAKTPTERGEAAYVQGWGLRMLRTFGTAIKAPDLPEEGEILRCFEAALEAAPANAVYWQSLGDAHMGDVDHINKGNDQEKAIAAYERSLALEERNGPLWYRLYQLYQLEPDRDVSKPSRDKGKARAALLKAAEFDPTNAFPLYRLAAMTFKDTRYSIAHKVLVQATISRVSAPNMEEKTRLVEAAPDTEEDRRAAQDAVALIEKGNHALHYSVPLYRSPFPDLLAVGVRDRWFLDRDALINVRDLHAAALPALIYAEILTKERKTDQAASAIQAVIGMGRQMIGNFLDKGQQVASNDRIVILLGMHIASEGYRGLEKLYRQLGNAAGAAQVAAELSTFQKFILSSMQGAKEQEEFPLL